MFRRRFKINFDFVYREQDKVFVKSKDGVLATTIRPGTITGYGTQRKTSEGPVSSHG